CAARNLSDARSSVSASAATATAAISCSWSSASSRRPSPSYTAKTRQSAGWPTTSSFSIPTSTSSCLAPASPLHYRPAGKYAFCQYHEFREAPRVQERPRSTSFRGPTYRSHDACAVRHGWEYVPEDAEGRPHPAHDG